MPRFGFAWTSETRGLPEHRREERDMPRTRRSGPYAGWEEHLRLARQYLGPDATDEEVHKLAERTREDYLDAALLPFTGKPGS